MKTSKSYAAHRTRARAALVVPVVASVLILGFAMSAADDSPTAAPKPEGHIMTSGPAVPLSATQRAALEAKRAATIVPPRVVEPVPAKGAEISTVPRDTGAKAHKAPPLNPSVVATSEAHQAQQLDERQVEEDAVVSAFLAALGIDIGHRAGLVKSDGTRMPARASTPGGVR